MERLTPPLQHVRIPFREIGEPGWVERSLEVLDAYGVAHPKPVPIEQIRAWEAKYGLTLPDPYVRFLTELGAMQTDEYPFFELQRVRPVSKVPHATLSFSETERQRLPHLVTVADYCSNGDPIALDTQTGECVLVAHDPVGLWLPLPSFSALARVAFLLLQDDGRAPGDFDAQIGRWYDWPFS